MLSLCSWKPGIGSRPEHHRKMAIAKADDSASRTATLEENPFNAHILRHFLAIRSPSARIVTTLAGKGAQVARESITSCRRSSGELMDKRQDLVRYPSARALPISDSVRKGASQGSRVHVPKHRAKESESRAGLEKKKKRKPGMALPTTTTICSCMGHNASACTDMK